MSMKVRDSFSLNPVGNTSKYTDFINYIDTSSVNAGLLSEVSFLEDEFPSRAQRLVRPGDILYSSVRPNLRHYYLYNDSYEHAVASTGFVLLRNNSSYNTRFAFYYLSTNEVVKYLSNIAELSQSTFPSFSSKDIGKIDLPDIDRKAQDQIVSILSAYDNLIEVNNKRIKVLEQMAENLYKEWFVRFRLPGHETAEFENGIPKGWRRGRISEFYTTSSGGTPSREHDEYYDAGTIPWIKTGELQDCLLIDTEERITEVAVKKSSAKFFPKDSVLMAMYGVNIGMLAYSTMDATCNQACCVFRDKGNISTKHYLFQCLKSIRDYLLLISFGAAQQNLSQDLIKRVRIVMPDEETVIRFEQKIEPLYNEIKHLLKANACLIRQRDLLLPRLMSGKLEV